jgi:hypothetical protein
MLEILQFIFQSPIHYFGGLLIIFLLATWTPIINNK